MMYTQLVTQYHLIRGDVRLISQDNTADINVLVDLDGHSMNLNM